MITLSGHGELEISGGKKILVGPGSINLVEDVTGKGHSAAPAEYDLIGRLTYCFRSPILPPGRCEQKA